MPKSVTIDGQSYNIPTTGDVEWGANFKAWAEAVSTATQTRTVVLNVKAYGAVGNGVADDTVAVAAAIAAAIALSGAIVYFPAGTYRLTSALTCGAGVALRGDGFKASKLLFVLNGSTDCIKYQSGVAYGQGGGIEGLHIYVASASHCRDLVSLVNWGEFRISDVRLEGAGRYGLFIQDGIDTDIWAAVFAGCNSAGLYAGTAGSSVTTTVRSFGCYFSGTKNGPGADVAGNGIDFHSCIFESNGATDLSSPGFRMRQGHVTMVGCYFENTAGHEMDIGTENGAGQNRFTCINPTIATGGYNQANKASINFNYIDGGAVIGGKLDLRTKSVVFTSNSSGVFLAAPISSGAKTPEYDSAGGKDITAWNGPAIILDGSTGDSLIAGAIRMQSGALAPVSFLAGLTTDYKGRPSSGWTKVTIPRTLWTAAATSQGLQVFAVPAKTKIKSVILDTTEAFAGLAGTITLGVGTASGGQNLLVDHDVKTAPVVAGNADADLGTAINRAAAVSGGWVPSWSTSTSIYVTLKSGAGNIGSGAATNLTNGTVSLYLELERLS